MRQKELLAQFTRDALASGRSRKDIQEALEKAGWTKSEIASELGAWAALDFLPPVPRPRSLISAREAFFYGLLFTALGMVAAHLTLLAFNLIDLWLPEPSENNYYRTIYQMQQIRWSIAVLIVSAPAFLGMNLFSARAMRIDPARRRSSVRRWLDYIALFLAAVSLLGDLVYTIYALLNGDLTLRFALKAAVVAVVAGTIFIYFRQELREDGNEP